MSNPPHLVVAVDEVDHVGNDGVARVLGRLAHHAKVQVAQIALPSSQQVAWTSRQTHLAGQTRRHLRFYRIAILTVPICLHQESIKLQPFLRTPKSQDIVLPEL